MTGPIRHVPEIAAMIFVTHRPLLMSHAQIEADRRQPSNDNGGRGI